MTNLLWPGDHRAGEHMTDEALLRSMVAVESAWLRALSAAGLAPVDGADGDLWQVMGEHDCEQLALTAEDGGNPVIGLVALLRERSTPAIAPWIHRGLTSQDVVDTSLMLGVRAVVNHLSVILREQISTLSSLAATHRATPMVARTLTQHAAPTTFGAKAAGWLNGVVDACERLSALQTPVQIGGAAGTRSAISELATLTGAGGFRGRNTGHRNGVGIAHRSAMAHDADADHRGRGRLRHMHRLLGPGRLGRRHPGPPGDRRTQ